MKPSRKLAIALTSILGIAYSLSAAADFAVKEEDIYDPCYRFPVKENYGNGQSCHFRRATSPAGGGCGGLLSADEREALALYLPIREEGRFYGRLSAGSSSYTLGTFKNRSTAAGVAAGVIVKQSATKSNPVVEIAVGYVWSRTFRGEIEYIANRNFTYTANPVLSNIPPGPAAATPLSFTAVIQTNPFLFNFYYDFKWFERFRPYVMAGVGFSINSIRSTVSPTGYLVSVGGTPSSGQRYVQLGSFCWDAGIGFRVRIFSHWYVDAQVRYVNMGLMKMRAMSNFEIEGIFSQTPATIGILYLF